MHGSAWFPPLVLLSLVLGLSACKTSVDSSVQNAERPTMPDPSEVQDPTRWLHNPLNMTDATVRYAGTEAWAQGTHEDTKIDDAGRLILDAPDREYPARGSWTSPVVDAAFPLTQVLPSMNLDAPEHTGVRQLIRVQVAGTWSPWLDLDGWGELRRTGRDSVTEFEHGKVDIDWVDLDRPADALQMKLELVSFDTLHPGRMSPAVRKAVAVYSGPVQTADATGQTSQRERGDAFTPGPRLDTSMPYFRQRDNGPALGPQTCSPTSVTMVLGMHGHELDPADVSEAIYDRRYGIFGNWARAVAYASTLGLDAELQRFRTWDDVRAVLEQGVPVIASIRFREGEFPSNQMRRTNGHLIVVRGLTEDGDAIVNDPAYGEGGEGVIYVKEELARAWLAKGGVGYVIRTP